MPPPPPLDCVWHAARVSIGIPLYYFKSPSPSDDAQCRVTEETVNQTLDSLNGNNPPYNTGLTLLRLESAKADEWK